MNAVLFDLDGTLLDTLEDIGTSCNAALLAYGFPAHAIEAYRYFVGDGVANLVSRALPENRRDASLIEAVAAEYRKHYEANWNASTQPYPGIPELISELGRREIKMAVLSNKPDDFTRRCVAEYFRPGIFSIVIGASEAFPRKPDPSAALHIAKEFAVAPARFAYLGDTRTDMQTAAAAGMVPFGVLWGFRPEQELRESGAKRTLVDPSEFLAICESLGG